MISFGAMNPHDPIFVAPPITEVPDYVWSRRYDKPAFLPGRPVQKPKDTSGLCLQIYSFCRRCANRFLGVLITFYEHRPPSMVEGRKIFLPFQTGKWNHLDSVFPCVCQVAACKDKQEIWLTKRNLLLLLVDFPDEVPQLD